MRSSSFKSIACLLSLFLVSCTSVRVRHEGIIATQEKSFQGFVFEKSFPAKRLPFYCILTGFFYGGFCWKYRSLPDQQQKEELVKASQTELDQKFGAGQYQLIFDRIRRISFDEGSDSLLVGDAKDMKLSSHDGRQAVLAHGEELKKESGDNRVELIFRNRGTGLTYMRSLNQKFNFGVNYTYQDGDGGRDSHHDPIRYASEFGLEGQYFLDGTHDTYSSFILLRPLYSRRTPITMREDDREIIDRSRSKMYLDIQLGVQFVFIENYHFSLSGQESVEWTPASENRSNHLTAELRGGVTF
ncbi:MAG: hypothetical protein A2X86_14945 [Bdellovibrionales bacterium GWA2_49_15]|nr:MAG: hypothetical protein A2X86_14945 [Bdellovibrionales bacterium GWA2_49_15]HAZ13360.1 hypothetical protein [Bdellovibrionales bacterium]